MENNKEEFLDKIKNNGKRGSKYLKKFNEINNKTQYICEFCNREIFGKGGYVKHKKLL